MNTREHTAMIFILHLLHYNSFFIFMQLCVQTVIKL